MKRIIGYIFCGVIGLFFLLFGIIGIGDSIIGMEDVTLVTGKLKIVEPATDEALGLTDMGPVIYRDTKMYQFAKTEVRVQSGDHYVTEYIGKKDFSYLPEGNFKAYANTNEAKKTFGKKVEFKNPEFPKVFLNEYDKGQCAIYGTVEIGDSGIKLDKTLLRFFDGESYSMKDYRVAAYNTPKDAGADYGLYLIDSGVYASKGGDNWEIGDMVVTYRVVDPTVLEGEFTAIGKLTDDNVLYRDDDVGALYDKKVTLEQANKDYKADSLKSGILFTVIALVILIGGFFLVTIFLE